MQEGVFGGIRLRFISTQEDTGKKQTNIQTQDLNKSISSLTAFACMMHSVANILQNLQKTKTCENIF